MTVRVPKRFCFFRIEMTFGVTVEMTVEMVVEIAVEMTVEMMVEMPDFPLYPFSWNSMNPVHGPLNLVHGCLNFVHGIHIAMYFRFADLKCPFGC